MKANNTQAYERAKKGTWVGIIGNFFLALLKIIIGIFGRSLALVADGIHSLLDITSSLAVLFGLIIASKPKDKRHPYGHGKAESLSSITIAILLVFLAFLMAWKSSLLLFQRNIQEPLLITFWIALIAAVLKEGMYQYKVHLAKALKSTSLMADAWHHRSDAFTSLVVVFAIAAAIFGGDRWQFLDKIAAIIISIIIMYVGIKIYIKAISELMDESVDLEMAEFVKEKAKQVNKVKSIETLLVRKSGLDFLVDIHIEVDPEMNVGESHRIAAEVKNKIINEVPQVKSVLVHIEPHYLE